MEKTDDGGKGTIVLATVRGDEFLTGVQALEEPGSYYTYCALEAALRTAGYL